MGRWRQARFAFCRTCIAGLRAASEVTTPIEDRLACSGHLMSVCIDGIQNGLLAAEPFPIVTYDMLYIYMQCMSRGGLMVNMQVRQFEGSGFKSQTGQIAYFHGVKIRS